MSKFFLNNLFNFFNFKCKSTFGLHAVVIESQHSRGNQKPTNCWFGVWLALQNTLLIWALFLIRIMFNLKNQPNRPLIGFWLVLEKTSLSWTLFFLKIRLKLEVFSEEPDKLPKASIRLAFGCILSIASKNYFSVKWCWCRWIYSFSFY